MEVSNGEDSSALWEGTRVTKACPTDLVLPSAPRYIAVGVGGMSGLEFYHAPFALTNNHASRGFIAYEYARVSGVPVLGGDRVVVGYADPLSSHDDCGFVVLPFFDDRADVKW